MVRVVGIAKSLYVCRRAPYGNGVCRLSVCCGASTTTCSCFVLDGHPFPEMHLPEHSVLPTRPTNTFFTAMLNNPFSPRIGAETLRRPNPFPLPKRRHVHDAPVRGATSSRFFLSSSIALGSVPKRPLSFLLIPGWSKRGCV